jgi:hypothetical protein
MGVFVKHGTDAARLEKDIDSICDEHVGLAKGSKQATQVCDAVKDSFSKNLRPEPEFQSW